MKKRFIPLYTIIAGAIGLALLALLLVIQGLSEKGIALYFGNTGLTASHFILCVALVSGVLIASAALLFLYQNVKKRKLKVFFALIVILAAGWFMFMGIATAAFMPVDYVELVSNDGEHCIIIAEDTYLFSVYGGDIYEKNSFCTMKKLTKYEAGIDYYTPFSDGKYEIVWGEESVEITYDFDGKGDTYKTITVEYLK